MLARLALHRLRWPLGAATVLGCAVAFTPIISTGVAVAGGAPVASADALPGMISTVAGGGFGMPGPGTRVAQSPSGLAVDSHGTVYTATLSSHILALDPATGLESVYAGTGQQGFSGDGGPAALARMGQARQIAVDSHDNLLLATTDLDRVRVVAASSGTFYGQAMTAGDLYTIAGDGSYAFSGDGLPALTSGVVPMGVAVDAAGNVVVADGYANRVRVVAASSGTFYGQAMTAGDMYTIGGNGHAGNNGDGNVATSAWITPGQVAVDGDGNVLLVDQTAGELRVIAEATGTFYGRAMVSGHIYQVDILSGFPPAYSPHQFTSVALDRDGNVLLCDVRSRVVRVFAASTGTFYGTPMTAGSTYGVAGGGTSLFSGDGGPATSASIESSTGAAEDSAGNLVFNDDYNLRVRVVAATSGTWYGQPMTAGDVYTIAGNGTNEWSGDRGPATQAFVGARDVAVDADGNLILADGRAVRVVAKSSGTFYGQSMTAGDIYTVAGNGFGGFSGDGDPATSSTVDPTAVAVDGQGNLVLAALDVFRVRVLAVSTGTFYGQAMTAGHLYTVAGNGSQYWDGEGPADQRGIQPGGVDVDGDGNLVITEQHTGEVLVLAVSDGAFYGRPMTAGNLYTVAGAGEAGFGGDGGLATSASLAQPSAVAVDASGNLLVADTGNGRVRVVAVSSGTFYGQAMVAGHIYTVAGNGPGTFGGSGRPATSVGMSPIGLAVDPHGDILVSDGGALPHRVLVVSSSGILTTLAGGPTDTPGEGVPATDTTIVDPGGLGVDADGNVLITGGPPLWTPTVRLVQMPVPAGAPDAPVLTAGPGRVDVSILAPPADGGNPVQAFEVLRGTSAAALSPVGTVPLDSGSSAVYSDSGLTGTTYYYAVAAITAAGTGAPSLVAHAIPWSAGSAGAYVAVSPTRILDTRTGLGAPKASVGPGGVVALHVTGHGGVPVNFVSAVVLNLTVTGPTTSGYVTAYPGGQPRPVVSNLDFTAGWTGANQVTVRLGPGGVVNLYNSSGRTQLIADVAGYYTASGAGGPFGQVHQLAPYRAYDSRLTAGPLAAQATRKVWVDLGGSVNPHVHALLVNLVAVGPTKVGYLTAWNGSGKPPATSILDFQARSTVANLAMVPVQPDASHAGQLQLAVANGSAGATNVVVDVFAYVDDNTVPGGLRFVAIQPVRVVDTRTSLGTTKLGPASTSDVALPGGLGDANTLAIAANLTAIRPGLPTYLSVFAAGQPQPAVSNVNAAAGVVLANAAFSGLGPAGTFTLYNDSGSVDAAVDVFGYFEAIPTG